MSDASTRLAGLLAELEGELRGQGCPLVERLAPGLPAAALDAPASRGLPLSEEARVWWAWHDGVPDAHIRVRDHTLEGTWELLPVERALVEYDRSRDVAAQVAAPGLEAEWLWASSWLPLVQRSNGDTIAVDCAVPPGVPTTLRLIYWDDPEHIAATQPSLAALVEVWLLALRSGAWRYEPGWGWHRELLDLPAPFNDQRFL